jgi:organic radical activating enzyme
MNKCYDISITTYCQLFCAGCQRNDEDNNWRGEFEQQHMSDETFDMIIEQIDKVGDCDVIQFCGELGDPMMHPRIDRFI